jgi:hypothetical protein
MASIEAKTFSGIFLAGKNDSLSVCGSNLFINILYFIRMIGKAQCCQLEQNTRMEI